MLITLRQLEIFEGVVATQNVTRASERLYVTQSAVSMALAQLERITGGPLFERQGKRLLLNDRGRLLLPEAREVLGRVRNVERALSEATKEPAGELRIGASTTIGNYILPWLVGEFARLYPKSKAFLIVGNTQQVETAVHSGELDVGLVEGPYHLSHLKSAFWREDDLVVIAGRRHPWSEKRTATSDMLATAPWIMRERGSGTREVFESAMAAEGIAISIALELGHTEAIKKAVEAGLGVGCLSRMAVQRELDNEWLVRIDTPLNLRRDLSILMRDYDYRTRLLEAWLNLLQDNAS
jgi:DNA-binding transcriptional LysR family regulator